MPDIDTLLKSVAPEVQPPSPGQVSRDLARGRAALTATRRRRTYRLLGAGGVITAAAVVALLIGLGTVVPGSRSATGHRSTLAHVTITPRNRSAARSGAVVQLVDYTGTQLPGFTVGQVPQGWHLSTSTPTALLITRNGSTNNDPDVFIGKLAVLVESSDEQGLGAGTPVTVNGNPGRFDDSSDAATAAFGPSLTFTSGGHGVVIQTPRALHWGRAQLVAFAEHVATTSHIGVSHG